MRELPDPWTQLVPAPRGAPGADIDDPRAHEVRAFGRGAWMPDGRSWIYRDGRELRRYFVESGEDTPIGDAGAAWEVVASPDGEVVYTAQTVAHVRRELITNFADRPDR